MCLVGVCVCQLRGILQVMLYQHKCSESAEFWGIEKSIAFFILNRKFQYVGVFSASFNDILCECFSTKR